MGCWLAPHRAHTHTLDVGGRGRASVPVISRGDYGCGAMGSGPDF